MSEISDLKQRVDAVGEKFGRLAEQESSYGERLTGLLSSVEEGFARSQRETKKLKSDLEGSQDEVKKLTGQIDAATLAAQQRNSELDGVKEEREKLSSELDGVKEEREKLSGELDGVKEEREKLFGELAGARDESKQLRGMLQTLLEAVEVGGNLDIGEAMRNLESRIDRIVISTNGGLDAEPAAAPKEPAVAPEKPAIGDPEADTPEPVEAEPAETKVSEAEAESTEDNALVLTSGTEPAAEPEPAAPAETDQDGAVAASATEPQTPAEPEEPKEAKKTDAPDDEAAEPPSDDDLSAVNKIIQRISLLTGEFVEPSENKSSAAEDKPIPSLKVGNGADDAPEAGARKGKASSKGESAAKTT